MAMVIHLSGGVIPPHVLLLIALVARLLSAMVQVEMVF